MYRVSGRQLAALALVSALLAALIVACAQRAIESGGGEIRIEQPVIADPSVATDEQNNIDVYRAVSPGVVNITSKSYRRTFFGVFPQEGTGSGSIIDDEGHILTNNHVVQNATELEVQIENEKYPARLVGTDPDNDLAVIRVDAPRDRLRIVKLGTSQGLQVGQKVLAIGNPFGLQRTLTTGIISGLERPISDPQSGRTIEGAIQTDASINPGNSGGPLLNARGEMIGINTAIYSPSGGSVGIGFAVPVDVAKKIIPDLIAKGYVAHPWLGISLLPLDRNTARRLELPVSEGIIVGNVYRGSGAAAAGIRGAVMRNSFWGLELVQLGDIILAVDGQPVRNSGDLQRVLKNKEPRQVVQVELLREGSRVTVPVRLSERPANVR
ncbi:MAG TPA: trypsin-like peptidase domain-containing protein [Blastocatellia bacterium]|nr:trypsin-like peptidase domain-containing protein [Blastocatellia bacterium]